MKIEALANNLIILTTNRGMVISVSDDGDYISIQRKIDVYHSTTKIRGELVDYIEHFQNRKDIPFDCDVVRVTQ